MIMHSNQITAQIFFFIRIAWTIFIFRINIDRFIGIRDENQFVYRRRASAFASLISLIARRTHQINISTHMPVVSDWFRELPPVFLRNFFSLFSLMIFTKPFETVLLPIKHTEFDLFNKPINCICEPIIIWCFFPP